MVREAGAETIQESLVETAGTLEKGKRDGDIAGALQEQINDPEFYKTIGNAGAMGAFGGAPFGACVFLAQIHRSATSGRSARGDARTP